MPRRKKYTDSEILVSKIVKTMKSKKLKDVIIMDLRKLTTITDFFVIGTGFTINHIKTVAIEIINKLKKEKIIPTGNVKNLENNWILLDYGDCFVHLFLKETREFYSLEKLWADAKIISSI